MSKIDTNNWKEFLIKDIFETIHSGNGLQVPTGATVPKKLLNDGKVPRVTVSNFNNGITGYYSDIDDPNYRVYENFISVSFLGTVFYHKHRASLDMKVHCLKPVDILLNENIAIFLVSVIRKTISNFMYSDQLSSSILPNLSIKLPVNSDYEPDWQYMDTYIAEIVCEVEETINALNAVVSQDIKI